MSPSRISWGAENSLGSWKAFLYDQTLLAVQMERGRRVPRGAAASGWWKGRWGQSPLGGAGEECILPTSGADPVVSVGALICRMGR